MEFITRAIEGGADSLAKREKYVDYIAKRPRAKRFGAHGLFTGADGPLALSQVADTVAAHSGNVWIPSFLCAGRTPPVWATTTPGNGKTCLPVTLPGLRTL